ncbi:hypothetical protein EUX98_g254 [Antrodiella citrinella]|uniref:DUF4211 domain-containing protein n=1 Tax=Antrodiella citrinella TaxID=2447956 RepID=A0A4S4N6I7_9APHY|nr:hypothetical protein EUX98_g254 [Antrodiella citrinella]
MPKKLKASTQTSLHDFLHTPSANSSPVQPPSSSRSRIGVPVRKQKKSRETRAVESDVESAGVRSLESGSDVGAIAFEPEVIELSDSDEEAKSSPRRPRTTRRIRSKREKSVNSDEVVSESPSEEPVGIPVWKGKARAGKRKHTIEDSDAEEEDVRPKHRKLIKGERPFTPEADDLMEELDEDKILDTRLRVRDKKSSYLKNLERMKRKKRGEKVSESEEDDEGDSDDELPVKPFKHARPGAILNDQSLSESADDEDEDNTFIIQDDNAPLDLPTEFSMSTYQDLTHHFKVICQLFIHLAVQEKDDRADFMEQLSKGIARRKIDGTRDSIVTSSIWRTDYKKPLQMYPVFEVDHMQFSVPSCDACRLGGRISTLTGRLSGEPYDKQTYEAISTQDSTDSDEDEPSVSPKKEFHLGRFCARRTRVFHEFTHWEYNLFHALEREVDDLRSRLSKKSGTRIYVPIAYAGGMQPPQSLKDADEVVAWLDSRHIIAKEVQRLKQMMESATNLEVASKRGEDDD